MRVSEGHQSKYSELLSTLVNRTSALFGEPTLSMGEDRSAYLDQLRFWIASLNASEMPDLRLARDLTDNDWLTIRLQRQRKKLSAHYFGLTANKISHEVQRNKIWFQGAEGERIGKIASDGVRQQLSQPVELDVELIEAHLASETSALLSPIDRKIASLDKQRQSLRKEARRCIQDNELLDQDARGDMEQAIVRAEDKSAATKKPTPPLRVADVQLSPEQEEKCFEIAYRHSRRQDSEQ